MRKDDTHPALADLSTNPALAAEVDLHHIPRRALTTRRCPEGR